jgi:hypothetical protein
MNASDVGPLCESLKLKALQVRRDDPAFWGSIPDLPLDSMSFEEHCWVAVKRYMNDDPALRDLPYSEKKEAERQRDPEGFDRRSDDAWRDLGLADWRTEPE